MSTELSYERMLQLVEARSDAARSALAGALDARVPGCPEWTGRELLAHLGEVQRFWSVAVRQGRPDGPPGDGDVPDREPSGDLLDWSERSTGELLDALTEAGPDRAVWSWWGPTTAGRIARHQVQEAGVHAWDAEDTVGRGAVPLPREVAADGIAEFLGVEVPTNGTWPHPPATVALLPSDLPTGHRVELTEAGGTVTDGPATGNAVLGGTASDLVLALYGRRPVDSLSVTGDPELAKQFLGWFTTT